MSRYRSPLATSNFCIFAQFYIYANNLTLTCSNCAVCIIFLIYFNYSKLHLSAALFCVYVIEYVCDINVYVFVCVCMKYLRGWSVCLVCMPVRVCVYLYGEIFNVCVYVCMSECIYIRAHACVRACECVCAYVRACIIECMDVCLTERVHIAY